MVSSPPPPDLLLAGDLLCWPGFVALTETGPLGMLRPHAADSADRPTGSCSLGVRRVPLPAEVIVLTVRWYLRFGPSYRDVEEPPARGIAGKWTHAATRRAAHTTYADAAAEAAPRRKQDCP
jgi:hypothetical protein